jgi:hypothetical protein
MEVMDRGLQLQSGETGVTFGLRALNASQDHLESLLALQPNVMGSTIATVTTAADCCGLTDSSTSTPIPADPRGIWSAWGR